MRTRFCRTALIGALATIGAGVLAAGPALAKPPDGPGPGPWADSVISYQQGLRANGTPVLPARSNPNSALGVAENDTAEGHFFSLGFGGQIVLGFKNKLVNGSGADLDINLVEATFEPYPNELVDVYALYKQGNTSTWIKVASNVNKDADLALPVSVPCTRALKLVDVSNKALFTGANSNADGYDVDGVKSLHGPGTPGDHGCDPND